MTGRVLSEAEVSQTETEYGYGWLASVEATMARHQKFADMIPDLITTIRNRDKKMIELLRAKARLADDNLALEHQNTLMLSALEQIANNPYGFMQSTQGNTFVKIARDTIAQVKALNAK